MPPKSWFLPRGPVLPSSNLSVAQVILAFCPSTARRRLLPTSLHGSTRVWPFIRSVSYRIVSIYGPLVRYVRRLAPGAAAANDETWPGYSLLPLRAGVPSHVYSRPAVPVRIHPCINHVTMAAELSSSSRSEFALGSTIRRTASNTTCIANQAFRQTDFFHEHGVSPLITHRRRLPSLQDVPSHSPGTIIRATCAKVRRLRLALHDLHHAGSDAFDSERTAVVSRPRATRRAGTGFSAVERRTLVARGSLLQPNAASH